MSLIDAFFLLKVYKNNLKNKQISQLKASPITAATIVVKKLIRLDINETYNWNLIWFYIFWILNTHVDGTDVSRSDYTIIDSLKIPKPKYAIYNNSNIGILSLRLS